MHYDLINTERDINVLHSLLINHDHLDTATILCRSSEPEEMGSGSRDGIGLKVEQTAMFGSMKRLLDETDKASIQIAPIICLSTKYWPVSGLIKLFQDINVIIR
ncbi:hypothetical protein DW881_08410 [Exiguobacterium sp. AM39-5BH]|nr:hypothetical protein DW881_08410 [Exiguobacterium sp. AM39-5BH]